MLNNKTSTSCVKSYRIRIISCPYFFAVGLNTDQKNSYYGHFSPIENDFTVYSHFLKHKPMYYISLVKGRSFWFYQYRKTLECSMCRMLITTLSNQRSTKALHLVISASDSHETNFSVYHESVLDPLIKRLNVVINISCSR